MSQSLFNTADCFAIVIISFIALFTRLWLIADPDLVTFDEVHFGNFTNWYIRKQFFFDIHPPLGKMIMAQIASFTQYKGDIDFGSKFGQSYLLNELFFVSLRITPAIFSAITSPFLFAACRCLSLSTLTSFCSGLILTTDISLIVEGKFILSDGILHFFTAFHIFTLCQLLSDDFDFLNLHSPPRHDNIWIPIFHVILNGVTLGCAISCKYTALGLLAVDGVTQIVWILGRKPELFRILIRALCILFPAVIVFLASWIWHFIILPFPGHNVEYLDKRYASTIISFESLPYAYWGDRLIGSSLFERIVHWNVVMNRINMRSGIPHPFESHPINWPLLLDRYVGFFSIENGTRDLQCMGNPFVYWFVFIGLVITGILGAFAIPFSFQLIISFVKDLHRYIISIFTFNEYSQIANEADSYWITTTKTKQRLVDWRNALFVWGWIVSYVPFIIIPRTMFLYHYLIPLMFGIMNLVALIENAFASNRSMATTILIIVSFSCVLCYLFFYPWAYGAKCPNCRETRMWTMRWVQGPPMPVNTYGIQAFNTTEQYQNLEF